MDLYQIEYFLAVIQYEGFSKAAERLNVSQPSLSVGIKKLERELGVVLFERGGRKALPTPAGKSFIEQAENIRQQYKSALDNIRDFQARPILKLGIICTLRISSVSNLVSQFRTQYPHIAIELRDGHIDEIDSWLEDGEIDLALTVLKDSKQSKIALILFQQYLRLAVPETHPFAKREIVPLSELDKQAYIQRINCEFWRESPYIYDASGIYPHIVYIANQEEWVIHLVRSGLGISVMPEWNNLSGIKYISVEGINLCRTIGLKWRQHQKLQIVNLFRDFTATQDYSLLL